MLWILQIILKYYLSFLVSELCIRTFCYFININLVQGSAKKQIICIQNDIGNKTCICVYCCINLTFLKPITSVQLLFAIWNNGSQIQIQVFVRPGQICPTLSTFDVVCLVILLQRIWLNLGQIEDVPVSSAKLQDICLWLFTRQCEPTT